MTAAFADSCGPPIPPSPTSLQVGGATSLSVASDISLTAIVHWGDGGLQTHTFAPNDTFTFTHIYRAPGTFPVTLDDHGVDANGITCSDAAQLQGVVTVVAPPGAPTAPRACWTTPGFSLTGRTAQAGAPFTWSNSNSNWPNLTETISWGDGTATDIATIPPRQSHRWSHTYAAPGTYEIRRHVSANFLSGTPCQHDESLGTITVLAPVPQPRPPAPQPRPHIPSSSLPTCARAVSLTAYWHHQIAIRHREVRRAKTPQAKRRAQRAYARAQRAWKKWRASKLSVC